ncbi:MAG: hypothetical protein WA188_17610 [Terriglobales bacterium]
MPEIDIKTAVDSARKFLSELFPEHARDILLEEVEKSGGNWLITLSFPGRDLSLFGTRIPNQRREYKTVEVDGATGEPRSVKIRVLNE